MDMEVIDKALKAERNRLQREIRNRDSTAVVMDQNAEQERLSMVKYQENAARARCESEEFQEELRRVDAALVDLHDRQGRGCR